MCKSWGMCVIRFSKLCDIQRSFYDFFFFPSSLPYLMLSAVTSPSFSFSLHLMLFFKCIPLPGEYWNGDDLICMRGFVKWGQNWSLLPVLIFQCVVVLPLVDFDLWLYLIIFSSMHVVGTTNPHKHTQEWHREKTICWNKPTKDNSGPCNVFLVGVPVTISDCTQDNKIPYFGYDMMICANMK